MYDFMFIVILFHLLCCHSGRSIFIMTFKDLFLFVIFFLVFPLFIDYIIFIELQFEHFLFKFFMTKKVSIWFGILRKEFGLMGDMLTLTWLCQHINFLSVSDDLNAWCSGFTLISWNFKGSITFFVGIELLLGKWTLAMVWQLSCRLSPLRICARCSDCICVSANDLGLGLRVRVSVRVKVMYSIEGGNLMNVDLEGCDISSVWIYEG